MELLQFVFSSFWVWLGCVVLIVAAGEAVATAAAGFRQKRKVSVYHVGDVTRVEVENAGRADIPPGFVECSCRPFSGGNEQLSVDSSCIFTFLSQRAVSRGRLPVEQ